MPKQQSTVAQLPRHIAIICDGNRRWAHEHKLEVFLGHRKALETVVEPLVDKAAEHGIEFITFWVFSTENWQRAPKEVAYLLDLFREFFDSQIKRLHEKNVRVTTIGDISKFPEDIKERIARGKSLTDQNKGITVVLALNYGGRDELLRALRTISSEEINNLTPQILKKHLDTAEIPDPDFIIRTSGEQRLSGFMLWQSEYAELAFPDFYFPEFTPEKLDELLAEYAHRKRRFGK